jgi:catechol 2,3-dioxygenase-like lactoylglutathione lyase family enzyme
MNNVAGVICLVKDLEKSVAFYEVLGFVFKKRVPNVAVTMYLNEFWIEFLLEDKVVTEAFKEDVPVSPKGAGQYIHINVEDVNEFYKGVVAKGLNPLSKPQDFPWDHREFVLADPDGYKLVFFTRLNAESSKK